MSQKVVVGWGVLMRCLVFNFLFLFSILLPCFSLSVLAESQSDTQNYLADEWEEQLIVAPILQSAVGSDADQTLLDATSIKIKADAAYTDEDTLSLARGSLHIISEGSPRTNFFLKADVQLNYFNPKDDLLITEKGAEYSTKVNDFWLQFNKQSCNLKVGRQGLFWGNVEGTRALDVVAPLDLTEPLLTDFSRIRRSQDMINVSCFQHSVDVELFVIPQPLLDLYMVRQTDELENLEDELNPEWGGRITHHQDGFDLSFYLGRFYDNAPKTIVDLNTLFVSGIYVNQFELYGLGLVYAIERLLIEVDISYQKERLHETKGPVSNHAYLLNKSLAERSEVSLGFEYTTSANHVFSTGIWFYDYERDALSSNLNGTYSLNGTWTKQYLNDDLALSALGFWQKSPEWYQLTLMAEYLMNDYWSISSALSYQHFNSSQTQNVLLETAQANAWTLQLSLEYQF